ncbi:hypothetical protein NHF46_14755 [Arthrobacter alpinus]|nr:hypothetical protein [Arthrobacter alpinus]
MATLEPETKQTDDTGASAGGLFSNSGLFSRTGLFGNSGPLIDQDPGGYAEGVAGGMGTGCAEGIGSGAGGAREARVVEGVRIPVPDRVRSLMVWTVMTLTVPTPSPRTPAPTGRNCWTDSLIA